MNEAWTRLDTAHTAQKNGTPERKTNGKGSEDCTHAKHKLGRASLTLQNASDVVKHEAVSEASRFLGSEASYQKCLTNKEFCVACHICSRGM